MVALVDVPYQKTPAQAQDVQQLIDTFTARRNTPVAVTVADPLAYALVLKNTDPAAKGQVIYAADGTTVLFSVDATGVKVSATGGAAVTPIVAVGSGAAPIAAAGDHVHGAGGYSSTGTTNLEALYASSWVSTGVDYGAGGTFGAGILYVFCTAGVTVTLPSAATTNRPITIIALTGSTTVAAASGTVNGGSVNTTTGAVMNGVVSQGDTLTYKSNGTNWYAV